MKKIMLIMLLVFVFVGVAKASLIDSDDFNVTINEGSFIINGEKIMMFLYHNGNKYNLNTSNPSEGGLPLGLKNQINFDTDLIEEEKGRFRYNHTFSKAVTNFVTKVGYVFPDGCSFNSPVLYCDSYQFNFTEAIHKQGLTVSYLDNEILFEGDDLSYIDPIIDSAAATDATEMSANENICRDSNGVLHVAYIGGGIDLWYGNSTDNGATWSIKELVSGSNEMAGILCDSNDKITVYVRRGDDIDFMDSSDGFTTLTTAMDLDVSIDEESCALGADNSIHCCAIASGDILWYGNSTSLDTEYGPYSTTIDDTDSCDIEVDDGVVFIVGFGTDHDDVDIFASTDNFTRHEVKSTPGAASSIDSISIAIDNDNDIHMAFGASQDLWYCNGTTSSLIDWTCLEIDAAASFTPDIAISENGDIHIMYSSLASEDGDVFRANSTDGINWNVRTQAPSEATSGFPSILDSNYPSWNNITDMLYYVYTSVADVYIENFTVAYTAVSVNTSLVNITQLFTLSSTSERQGSHVTTPIESLELSNVIGRTASMTQGVQQAFTLASVVERVSSFFKTIIQAIHLEVVVDRIAVFFRGVTGSVVITPSINATNVSGGIPLIGLELITPLDLNGVNATQNQFFNVSVNVSCSVSDCGEINVSFDPISTFSPGMIVNNDSVGTNPWISPENASSNDGEITKATCSGTGCHVFSNYLKATNFSANIPSSATLNGIFVEINNSQYCAYGCYANVSLVLADDSIGSVEILNTSGSGYAYRGYGNLTYLWGESFTPEDINNDNFGIVYHSDSGAGPGGSENVRVDHIQLQINYTNNEKSGLISTTEGDTPFYTNSTQNPINISLNEGESQIVTMWINATGTVGTNHTFFVFANRTANMSQSNITGQWNVTIISGSVVTTKTISELFNIGSILNTLFGGIRNPTGEFSIQSSIERALISFRDSIQAFEILSTVERVFSTVRDSILSIEIISQVEKTFISVRNAIQEIRIFSFIDRIFFGAIDVIETAEIDSTSERSGLLGRIVSSPFILFDSVERIFISFRNLLETFQLDSFIDTLVERKSDITQQIQIGSSINRIFYGTMSVSSTFDIESSVGRVGVFGRINVLAILISDSVTSTFTDIGVVTTRLITSLLNIFSSTDRLYEGRSFISDIIILDGESTIRAGLSRINILTITISDSVSRTFTEIADTFTRDVISSFEITSFSDRVSAPIRNIVQSITIESVVERTTILYKQILSSFIIESSVDRFISIPRTIIDSFTITSSTNTVKTFVVNVTSSFSIDSVVGRFVEFWRITSQQIDTIIGVSAPPPPVAIANYSTVSNVRPDVRDIPYVQLNETLIFPLANT